MFKYYLFRSVKNFLHAPTNGFLGSSQLLIFSMCVDILASFLYTFSFHFILTNLFSALIIVSILPSHHTGYGPSLPLYMKQYSMGYHTRFWLISGITTVWQIASPSLSPTSSLCFHSPYASAFSYPMLVAFVSGCSITSSDKVPKDGLSGWCWNFR